MNNVRFLWPLILLLSVHKAHGQTEHYTLTIGESMDVNLDVDDVTVSRKGIVDLFHRDGSQWTLTGLKRGFVLIKSRSVHLKITVVDSATSDPEAAPEICESEFVDCQNRGIRIHGIIPTARSYYMLLSRCRNLPHCTFLAVLSDTAAAEVENIIGREPLPGEAMNDSVVYCAEEQERYELLPEWLRPFVKVICQKPEFYIEAHFISLTDSDLERLGVAHKGKLTSYKELAALNLKQIVDAKLVVQRQIVAMPSLRVLAGETASIDAGGEFFVTGSDPEHNGSWKKFGMQLTLGVEPRENGVQVKYRIQMTGRGEGSSLNGNLTESVVSLPLGQQQLVAQVPFFVSQHEDSGSFLLANLPLLGPWIGTSSTLTDTRQLFVYFKVEPSGRNGD